MRLTFRFVILSVILTTLGCAGGPRPRAGVSVTSQRQEEIIRSLRRRDENLTSLRGFASVRVGRGIFGTRGETAFVIQQPDRVRIDGLSDFGLYASQLCLYGDILTVVWPNDHLYFRGEATPEALQRFLLVDLPAAEVGRILMSRLPLSLDGDLTLGQEKGHYLVRTSEGLITVERREGDYIPVQVSVLDAKGKKRYEVIYKGYHQESSGLWMPEGLEIRFSNPKVKMELRFKDLEVNPKLDNKIFRIAIPDDADEISFP